MSTVRYGEIQFWSLRHDAGRVDGFMTVIVMLFDMLHVNRLGDTRLLIEVA